METVVRALMLAAALQRATWLLFVATMMHGFAAFAQVPPAERDALIALYESTNGEQWYVSTNWCNGECPLTGPITFNAPGTECTWMGITCDASHNVITISLIQNHLTGTLPSLTAFGSLQFLDISYNQVAGSLPPLSALSQLKYIRVGSNLFTGDLPPAPAGGALLPNASSLCPNPLNAVPDAAWDTATGEHPWYMACLVGVSGKVVNTINFESTQTNAPVLTAYAVDESGLVAAAGVVGDNVTTGHWNVQGLLPNTPYTIVLSTTPDVAIGTVAPPPSLPPGWVNSSDVLGLTPDNVPDGKVALVSPINAVAAVEFDVYFAVPIPAAERTVLQNIYATAGGVNWYEPYGWNGPVGTECNWARIECDLDPVAPHVTGVILWSRSLSGTLPPIADLTHLQVLNVSQNNLYGSLPSLSGLSSLQAVYAYDNHFSGSIPDLSGLSNLDTVMLWNNELSGPIPPLSQLTKLQYFLVDENFLTGEIPELSGLSSLASFDVQLNYLTGSIPSLSGLQDLFWFNAAGNRLTGTLPPLDGLASLEYFRAGYNNLEGTIPSLTGLSKLKFFAASYNRLSGPIPSLSGLNMLQQLLVAHNFLTGPVPVAPPSLFPFSSLLCPNPLDTEPGPNDAAWSQATGYFPWWSNPFASNRCDDIFEDVTEPY